MKSIAGVFVLSFATAACSGSAVPAGSFAGATTAGYAAANYKMLLGFDGTDGSDPTASLINLHGTLYGTTYTGGMYNDGTVFTISTTGTERVLHSFGNGSDGSEPFGGLVALDGKMYGTTFRGGGPKNEGIVFSVNPEGKEQVLYSFGLGRGSAAFIDGRNPEATLTVFNGALIGTTYNGGKKNGGAVFSITAAGDESLLYSFGSAGDGAHPYAGVLALDGTLYGATSAGGANGHGALFSLRGGRERVLYSFRGGSDGSRPYGQLVAIHGTLYGTTYKGGAAPYAGLTDLNGMLYGATAAGGATNLGTVFALSP